MTRQYENLSLSGCQILCQKSAKSSSDIKTVLFTFSEPKYLKRLLQNYFFYKNPRILGNVFRKVFRLTPKFPFTLAGIALDYEQSPFSLRHSRASETRAWVKITLRLAFLTWCDFHAPPRFARSTIREQK